MINLTQRLAAGFPAPDEAAWRALVDKTLKGRPYETLVARTAEGLDIDPYAAPGDGPALLARRGPAADTVRPWDVRVLVDSARPAQAAREAVAALQGGAASLLLKVDPAGLDGVALADSAHLAEALEGVEIDLAPIALDAGLLGPIAAGWLAVRAKGAPNARLHFHMDPISAFAEAGLTPGPVAGHLLSAANTAARHAPAYPKATAFLASGRVIHEAGGGEAQELGFAAASALAYAKACVEAGLDITEAFERVTLGLSADADALLTIAKLRAARAVWARITQACGVALPARIEARSSRRMLSRLDPFTNLLRLTAAAFGAGVGGADAVVLDVFTRPLGGSSELARRQARNIQLVLAEEAHLGRVADPAGGAAFIERVTDDLARAAWSFFQAIEGAGGAIAALESGFVADKAAEVAERRRSAVASGAAGMIGVTDFPDLDAAAPTVEARETVEPLAIDIRLPGADSRCPPLTPIRLAEPIEALRDRAVALQSAVAIVSLNESKETAALVAKTRSILTMGGLRVTPADLGAPLAVVCGPAEALAGEGPAVATGLRRSGVRAVYACGGPLDGADGVLAPGSNVLPVLESMLARLEADQ